MSGALGPDAAGHAASGAQLMQKIELFNRSWEGAQSLSAAGASLGAGTFFVVREVLQPGAYTVLFQIQLARGAPDCEVRFSVHASRGGEIAASMAAVGALDPDDRHLLHFNVPQGDIFEFRGWVSANQLGTLLRFATIVGGTIHDPHDPCFDFGHVAQMQPRLDAVIIGTTTTCPASCQLCPTNKPIRSPIPKGTMSMEVFEKLVMELADVNYEGPIVFGLFGEPLSDPRLADRLRLCKQVIPGSHLGIATTCATYDPARHEEIITLADSMTVHLESFERATYNEMMAPLRLERVFPNIAKLAEAARGKTRLTMPLNRHNVHEIRSIIQVSEDLGLDHPLVSPLSNRCGESAGYEAKTIFPMATACHPGKIETELVVDWDGTILTCCFDFLRAGADGNIMDGSLREYLLRRSRGEIVRKMAEKKWHALRMCKDCRFDDCSKVEDLVAAQTPRRRPRLIDAARFSRPEPSAARAMGSLDRLRRMLRHEVWGPYERLPVGQYFIEPQLAVRFRGPRGRARMEVLLSEREVARVDMTAAGPPMPSRISFSVTQPSLFQFRVSAFEAEVDFSGLVIGQA